MTAFSALAIRTSMTLAKGSKHRRGGSWDTTERAAETLHLAGQLVLFIYDVR